MEKKSGKNQYYTMHNCNKIKRQIFTLYILTMNKWQKIRTAYDQAILANRAINNIQNVSCDAAQLGSMHRGCTWMKLLAHSNVIQEPSGDM